MPPCPPPFILLATLQVHALRILLGLPQVSARQHLGCAAAEMRWDKGGRFACSLTDSVAILGNAPWSVALLGKVSLLETL